MLPFTETAPIAGGFLLISLLLHLLALSHYLFLAGIVFTAIEPDSVFYVLWGCSLVLAALSYAVRSHAHFRILVALRLLLCILIGFAFTSYLAIETVLLTALVLETGIYEPFPLNLRIGLGCIAVAAAFPNYRLLFDADLADRFTVEILRFVLVPSVAAVLSSLLLLYRERMLRSERRASMLDGVVAEMSRANADFLEYASSAAERSAEKERNRLTSELHDTIGYTLTNITMMMEAGKDLVERDPARLRDLLGEARDQALQGLAETRRTLHLLRGQEKARETGLASIHRLVKTFERATGVRVKTDYSNFPFSCGEEIDAALYHCLQEGLTNSFRHGNATLVEIFLKKDDNCIQAILRDNGRGAAQLSEGIGVSGMRERVGDLGGTLSLRPRPDGFELLARIPLRE